MNKFYMQILGSNSIQIGRCGDSSFKSTEGILLFDNADALNSKIEELQSNLPQDVILQITASDRPEVL